MTNTIPPTKKPATADLAAMFAPLIDHLVDAQATSAVADPEVEALDELASSGRVPTSDFDQTAVYTCPTCHTPRDSMAQCSVCRTYAQAVVQVAEGTGFSTVIRGVKIAKCDTYSRTESDFSADALRRAVDAALALTCRSCDNDMHTSGGKCYVNRAALHRILSEPTYDPEDAAPEVEQLRAANRDLIDALRLTVEYVGTDTLPASPGWSWYDALTKHAPDVAARFSPAVEVVLSEVGNTWQSRARRLAARVAALEATPLPPTVDGLAAAINESLDFREGSILHEAVNDAVRDAVDHLNRVPALDVETPDDEGMDVFPVGSLSRTRSVLDLAHDPEDLYAGPGDGHATFTFPPDTFDPDVDLYRAVRIDRDTWRDLGSPTQITVTIVPGDHLTTEPEDVAVETPDDIPAGHAVAGIVVGESIPVHPKHLEDAFHATLGRLVQDTAREGRAVDLSRAQTRVYVSAPFKGGDE